MPYKKLSKKTVSFYNYGFINFHMCSTHQQYSKGKDSPMKTFSNRSNGFLALSQMNSQKRHRLIASCQFYRLVNNFQQACQFHLVARNLLRSGLLQLSLADMQVETSCSQLATNSVEIIKLQQAC